MSSLGHDTVEGVTKWIWMRKRECGVSDAIGRRRGVHNRLPAELDASSTADRERAHTAREGVDGVSKVLGVAIGRQ